MQYAHHLVVFVGQDVAVPDVAARFVKMHFDAGNLPGQGRNHVLGGVLDVSYRLLHRRAVGKILNFNPMP